MAEAAKAKAGDQVAQANALQQKLIYLNRDMDDAADALVTGDVQAERFRVLIINLENALINSWGRRNGYSEELPVPSCSDLFFMKADVADWSRIRPVLKERLAKAQELIAERSAQWELSARARRDIDEARRVSERASEWSPRERCDIDVRRGAQPENWGQFESINRTYASNQHQAC